MRTAIDDIAKLLGNNFEKCESPSLRLEKFVHLTKNAQSERGEEIAAFIKCHGRYASKNASVFRHPTAVEMIATLGGNLIVNQSGGILENAGLCLDPIQNVPYIPGSAVKGVASHAAWMEWKDDEGPDMALRIARVFGYPTNHRDLDKVIESAVGEEEAKVYSGSVCFMAAVPFGKATIKVDIATTHHPNYYQGKQPKALDNEAPVPLPFPVVEAGSQFVFGLIPLRNCHEQTMADARHWLELAMTVCGMGAKTAAGYGWFEYNETKSQAISKEEHDRMERELMARKKAEQVRIEQERQQQLQAAKAKAKKDLEEKFKTMSPDEQWDYKITYLWDEVMFKNRLGMFWQTGKGALVEEEKKAIVRALKGSKKTVWDEIKNTRQKKGEPPWPRIADEVRKLNKTTYGDKMP